jgi:hypothetical protein
MPILVMALLALAAFGLIGIMLVVAVLMEHSTPRRTVKTEASYPAGPGAASFPNPNFDRPRGAASPTENPSEKEKVHEHACTG